MEEFGELVKHDLKKESKLQTMGPSNSGSNRSSLLDNAHLAFLCGILTLADQPLV